MDDENSEERVRKIESWGRAADKEEEEVKGRT